MVDKVRKRDGSVVKIQPEKITEAIWKAAKSVGGSDREKAEEISKEVRDILSKEYGEKRIPDVESVQNLVEKRLIENGHAKVAKAYILYRKSHEELRNVKGLFDTIEVVDDYIGLNDWMVKENSNMGFSLQGLNNYISSKIIRNYWMRRVYPEAIRKAHENGDLHIHDLGILGAYCVGWDLKDLLTVGFTGARGKVESKPAKHLRSALGQTVNFFYTLQGECYSDDTYVLTDNGWKLFKDIDKKKDKFYTLNPKNKKIELQKPTNYFEFESKEMINFRNNKIDLLVTPNHNMLVAKYNPDKKRKEYDLDFVKANKYNSNTHLIPKGGEWLGKKRESFKLPSITLEKYQNYGKKWVKEKVPEVNISMNDWLAFFGMWLSEGSCSKVLKKPKDRKEYHEYYIRISQNNKNNHKKIEKILSKLPFKWNKKSNGNKVDFVIYGKQLYNYLSQFGKSKDKFIPKEIKNLEKKQLDILFDFMMLGDGHVSNGNHEYYTNSQKLANDVQEIVLKKGFNANIRKKGNKLGNWYVVAISRSKYYKLNQSSINRIKYNKKVYCVEVPNHTLYVKRNGKACWSGNSAGAQALSNVDTYMAPFIRYDNLDYKQVKQIMQEFLFNMAVPTRVGFQCMSEDTEILTPNGWASYDELKKGDTIKTFNIEKQTIENKPIKKLFAKKYNGVMYNLKNRIQDQLISPNHRVVRKKFQTNEYALEPIEDILKLKSPIITPIAGDNAKKDINISDEKIKLIAWIIGEGSIERPGKNYRSCYRINIYQSENKKPQNYKEIKNLLNHFNLKYSEYTQKGLGEPVKRFRLNSDSSKKIHSWFGTKESVGFIPDELSDMSKRQSLIFLETYIKAEGFEDSKIATTDLDICNKIQAIASNAGYGSTVLTRKPTIGTKPIYVIRLIKHKDTYIQEIKKVNYSGTIWCPNTDNETVIARRNGKVFITGNTPFTNVTLDLKVPNYMKDEPVMIGGEPQKETYKEFQKEMDMFNQAFAEVMIEGDASGRPFTFPIPTYNITKDFDWDNPNHNIIWEMTAKYGIPYFSNFVNSDMNPEDARSMCPLAADEKVLIKSSRGRGTEYSSIRNIYSGQSKQDEYEIYADGKFVKGKFSKYDNQNMFKVTLENNHEMKISEEHLNYVLNNEKDKEKTLIGKELNQGMYLPYSLKPFEGKGGNKELGFFVGAYAGDGSFDGETSVIFSLEENYKKYLIPKLQKIAEKYFGAQSSISKHKKTKLVTLKIHSKAAVGLCKDFVQGKEREKHYSAKTFTQSKEFRKGVLEGHYATDGGNRNRIYTSSKKMVETLNMLAASLGTTTCIYKDEREGRLGKEPNYSVLVYKLNRQKYGNIWFKKNNKLWMKIKEIKKISNSTAYCFEVKKDKPLFTIGTTGILTHNCRLRLDQKELRKRGGGLFGANPQTGSIGVVTVNMPRLGFTSRDEQDFFTKLEELMDLAKESLEIKRKTVEAFTEKGLYPYSKFYLRQVKQRFGKCWQNHFATIGLLGMNEAIANFLEEDITTSKGHDFAIRVMDFMRKKLEEYQEETGNIYNLEATPGEGTSHRFARMDKKKFGRIKVANEEAVKENNAKPYYTNSTQLPVWHTEDLFEALDLQDELQTKYTGGTVFHSFIGEKLNPEAVKNLVKKISHNYHLPYFTISPTFSICPIHGYLPGEHEYCPKCDAEIEAQEQEKQSYTTNIEKQRNNERLDQNYVKTEEEIKNQNNIQ